MESPGLTSARLAQSGGCLKPRSGAGEDTATGIAASALAFGLLKAGLVEPDDRTIRVLQGRAMGSLSEIRVRVGFADGRPVGCLVGGTIAPTTMKPRDSAHS